MMNKLVTTLLVSSLVLGGVTLAQADSDRYEKGEYDGKYCNKGKDGKGRAYRIERMATELGLSESQLKQVRAVEAKYHPKMQELRGKKKAGRQSLREVMQADNVDQAAVKKLVQQQGDLKVEKIMLRSQMRAEIDKVLTAEQRAKMKEMRSHRSEGYHKHGKKHHD